MHRNSIRRALASIALLSAVSAFSPAHAGSITLSDANCDSFTLVGSPPNQTLSCVVTSVPVCTVNGPSTAQINTSVTLTAQCTPAATSYAWTGGNCTTGQTCSATEQSAVNRSYTVTGTNTTTGTGSPSGALNVAWTNAPPAVPSGCTLTPSPTSLPAGGGAVTLTAACSGGGAATNYAWTGGAIPASGTSAQVATSVTGTTTFTVRPSNGGGNGNLASVSVTVAGSGGGGGAISCPGYSSVIVLNLNYAVGVQSRVVTTSTFGNNDIVVAKFTTGTLSNYGKGGFLNVVENSDGPVVRTAALSTTPCDFTQGTNNVASNIAWPQINFSAPNSYGTPLQSNTTYYLNVINKTNTGTATCSTGDCPVAVTLQGR
ncbi:MAG: hypothetical protein ABI724_07135 [Betaproteobacteria bacterium]